VKRLPSPPLAFDFFAEDIGEFATNDVTSEPNPRFLAGESADNDPAPPILQTSTFPDPMPEAGIKDAAPPPSPTPRFAGENIPTNFRLFKFLNMAKTCKTILQ
jgi:hypothetical protein